ncbi:MAG: endonuclease III [Melioribacteraceae bacterium]|nr:endonuclease III [Melioribacteraceae bacterium]MCF8263819.1 endonuclease III [Melioribacteraceae bacterium]MCF8413157.1 endonuclease III [Melioribacteraceae bacterium]MCF8431211.1 endonuclease III [Melioribacteraceae bacterium]
MKDIKARATAIFDILRNEYPKAEPALNYNSAFQLLIATILSAQCTDARVNLVTEELFKKYKTPKDFISVSNEELEKDIYSTGFYRQKAKSIKECCISLEEKYNGEVPEDFEKLTELRGVGRKTASVVAGNAFGIPAVAVDTHVKRLSNLMGFINSTNPEKIEERIKELLPPADWVEASHWLATHGRNVCIARRPKCFECKVSFLCPSAAGENN